jgi:hypothetical protein
MHSETFTKLDGEVEVDATFIGGKARNMHKSKREGKISGTGGRIRQRSWDSWNVVAKS